MSSAFDQYHRSLTLLSASLKTKIHNIHRATNMSPYKKLALITTATSKYNKKVKKLTQTYEQHKQKEQKEKEKEKEKAIKRKEALIQMKHDVVIVVARYNENIEWTKQLPNVRIYNKGSPIPYAITLPNVGREGHTYYTHLVENYDNLPDYTIFLQGNPFDHSPHILENIYMYLAQMQNSNDDLDFAFLSEEILECSLQGCQFHPNLPLMEVYQHLFLENENEEKDEDDKKDNNILVDPAFRFRFGAGAQFIVSKRSIRQRPKAFYSKIVKLLEYDINPIEGFVIERFHELVFR